ncbi:MAG: GGDEF domain-containing protein [Gammaproteobacteria bacterium]|nr:GGDEF domain-containing protein [Gammaproteobacteria bacterium]
MKRTSEEYILITLSFGGSISILPFAIFRMMNGEWYVAAADSIMVVGMFILGIYVYLYRQVQFASIVLSILAVSGVVTVIHLKDYTLLNWVYPTLVGVFYILTPSTAFLITSIGVIALVPALIRDMAIMDFIAALMTLVVINVFAYVFASKMHEQREQLYLLIRKDPLTGIGNRRALDEKLEEYTASQPRTGMIASLIMLDLDHFKKINDIYGHIVGDQILVKFTELINNRIRISDSLYRFGGEEFVLIALGTSASAAEILAEDLRKLIESATLLPDTVTISLGVAEYAQGASGESWIHRCDCALYDAKNKGRNRVCVAE